MPKLIQGQPFLAEVGQGPISGGRRASAQEFGAVGSALQGFGGTVANVGQQLLQDQEASDQRDVMVKQAQIKQKYAKELEDARISGADVDKIKERLQNDLSTVTANVTTRKGVAAAEFGSANTMNVFDSQVAQINVERAGQEARTKGAEFINAQAAILQGNPSYLPLAEAEIASFVDTFAHRLSPQQRSEIERQLVQQANVSAASASARLDPQGTKELLQKGEWNLSGEQRQQLIGMSDSQIRARRADEDHARVMAEHQKRERNEEARDNHFKKIMDGTFRAQEVMADPDLTAATREHLIVFREQWAKRGLGEERKSNPAAFRDLYLRINAPDDDPNKIFTPEPIMAAVAAGSINVTDAERLRAGVANNKDENNRSVSSKMGAMTARVGQALNADPRYIGQPALVASMQNQFSADVETKVKELRDSKVNPAEAFNPSSKHYVGSKEFIAASIEQAKQSVAAAGAPALEVGTVRDGFRYRGGNPAKRENWEKVLPGEAVLAPAPAAPAPAASGGPSP